MRHRGKAIVSRSASWTELPKYVENTLMGLRRFVGATLQADGKCKYDHTLCFTREYVREHGLEEETVTRWLSGYAGLSGYGGRCDCEAYKNITAFLIGYLCQNNRRLQEQLGGVWRRRSSPGRVQ